MASTTSTKNHLQEPFSRESLFKIIDSYFEEGRLDMEFEVSREEIVGKVPELSDLKEAVKTAREAAKLANEALQVANRKSGSASIVEVRREGKKVAKVEGAHKQFELLLKVIASGCHAYLAGPAGSGKTTAAEGVAKALGLAFHFTGAVATEFQLTGFVDARGIYHSTPFRRWCEQGGVFLWDEIDASDARALLRFNAALANGICEFPDGVIVKLHESCVAIAAANTFGQGADRVYVGRNQLDGASLDRFVFIGWDYDTDLEERIAGHPGWVRYVQKVRASAEALKIRAVISPRASIFGARLIDQGLPVEQVASLTVWKGMDAATVAKIRQHAGV